MSPEDELERLPHGGNPNSFRVLAEWLRDNRRMLEGRLDKQDAKLEAIHSEVRKTNGRVTDLEHSAELAVALQEGKSEGQHDAEEKTEKREDRREHRRDFWIGTLSLFGAAAVGGLGHAIGWW